MPGSLGQFGSQKIAQCLQFVRRRFATILSGERDLAVEEKHFRHDESDRFQMPLPIRANIVIPRGMGLHKHDLPPRRVREQLLRRPRPSCTFGPCRRAASRRTAAARAATDRDSDSPIPPACACVSGSGQSTKIIADNSGESTRCTSGRQSAAMNDRPDRETMDRHRGWQTITGRVVVGR